MTQTLQRHCDFDSFYLKDMMSFAPWKTITEYFCKFVLILLPPWWYAFIWWRDWRSSMKAQPTKKSSQLFNITSICQSVDMLPAGGCQRLGSIILQNDTSLCERFDTTMWPTTASPRQHSENGNLFLSLTHGQSDRLLLFLPLSLSLSPPFSQCIPNPLVVGVEQVGDQVCSIWTVRVIIQRTAALCPTSLQQIHYPGTNLKRSNISSILPLQFPLMQYIWNLII